MSVLGTQVLIVQRLGKPTDRSQRRLYFMRDIGDERLPQVLHLVQFQGHLIHTLRQFTREDIGFDGGIQPDLKISFGDLLHRLENRLKEPHLPSLFPWPGIDQGDKTNEQQDVQQQTKKGIDHLNQEGGRSVANGVIQPRRQEKDANPTTDQEQQRERSRRDNPGRWAQLLRELTSRRYPNPRIVLLLKE